ncbi:MULTISPECIES: zinc-binding dehydrogenase [Rhodococcus]|uniref:Zinc binding alcohol dehydrogenase n=2 Tax=Rhodococcus pyridinivorans TaxID=103816 RepID=H0JS24_9NOCA|nr:MULTISPECIES: zinc-binding dehydrogenase [Rhodococcus]AOD21579.1 hypothetical protein IM25_08110 [Rhodococcus sp. p52]EHK83264.1 zinc binding alcohol dehydrogenase [Rhodococcus pyridinivorans AK37]MCD2117307.1 zinc-binding dehydrogenase [Rhodococcus pyridinivorans]MCD2142833.1 zinc-binding dehydrogenase [Rhodococcus pyridinivorans]MCZ4626429.1 zinc-binding dehydrogenase [Rhodococcus pyridinivorans]
MTRTRAAAVLREYGAPLRLETVTVPELRDDEVLVQIHGVGICHTDLTAATGGVPVPRPVVPGHEGAGVVTEQGSTIVVFDLGAVGTAAVMTERISLCENIIVVAPDPRRHGLARSLGATEVLSPDDHDDLGRHLRRLTGGGAGDAVESVGAQSVIRQALSSLTSPGVSFPSWPRRGATGTFHSTNSCRPSISRNSTTLSPLSPPARSSEP